jgi:hypothetical protein
VLVNGVILLNVGGGLWNILFHGYPVFLEFTYIAREIADFLCERKIRPELSIVGPISSSRFISYVFLKFLNSLRSFAYSALKFLDSSRSSLCCLFIWFKL